MTSATLNVYLFENLVGRLWQSGRTLSFQYDEGWLDNPSARPLSLSLPLRMETYDNDTARAFFSNILPEESPRIHVARALGISPDNDLSLLEALGGECAGAVSLYTGDKKTSQNHSGYRKIDYKTLLDILREMPTRPFLAGEKEIRLSLAGAQDKLPLAYQNGDFYLPLAGAPSSHIIKPAIAHVDQSVLNETYCMALANFVQLPVPAVQLVTIEQKTVFLVQRYDRDRNDSNITRIHQEDFCQAIGILPQNKYEAEGGPSLSQCFALVRNECHIPLQAIRHMLRWTVFNYLIGNADAHGKNLSLLYDQGSMPGLAPFYDLMSTKIYGRQFTDKMAMSIGSERRLDWIQARHWEQMAEQIGIKPKIVHRELKTLAELLLASVEDFADSFTHQYKLDKGTICDEITKLIRKRAQSTLNRI